MLRTCNGAAIVVFFAYKEQFHSIFYLLLFVLFLVWFLMIML